MHHVELLLVWSYGDSTGFWITGSVWQGTIDTKPYSWRGIVTLHLVVQAAVSKLGQALQSRLPDTVESIYVYGSNALGAYVEGSSDIDFIALVNRPLFEPDIHAIKLAHEEVERAMPGLGLMGAYLRPEQLGKPVSEVSPFPCYYEKELRLDGKGADLNPVTWRILRDHGICAYGTAVTFAYEAPEDELLTFVIRNMNTYWAGWVDKLEQAVSQRASSLTAEQQDEAVEWCVLGMLRQLYTIRERGITSKLGAGSFGLEQAPQRWHALIREAVAIKRLEPERVYGANAKEARLSDLVELLRWIHAESNRLIKERYPALSGESRPSRP